MEGKPITHSKGSDNQIKRSNLFIGTSGYSYPDWKGVFYPDNLPTKNQIGYYSSLFEVLEINYTYYRMPEKKHLEKMINQSNQELIFTVKAHQSITHESFDDSVMQKYIEGLAPLISQKRLGAILFQFPFRFKMCDQNWTILYRIKDLIRDIPGVVEFRNDTWIRPEVFGKLAELGLNFCSTDQPSLEGLPGIVSALTGPLGYIRFHGRNSEKWWRNNHAWERYSYDYQQGELRAWLPVMQRMTQKAKQVFVLFNNHYAGQAPKNAGMLIAIWKE